MFTNNNPERKYFIHVGGTGSGKTFQAIERLKKASCGIYLAPLRLLAWEVADKLIGDGFPCNLITGEEQIMKEGALFDSCTIEMMNCDKHYEVVVIDEAFMIGDADRGKSWLRAILSANAREVHIIINYEAFNLLKKILSTTKREVEIKKYEALQKFRIADHNFSYSRNMQKRGIFVTFSRIDVLINKMKLEQLGMKVSVLYGNLPPEVKKRQIANFISGVTDLLVTTDVIGMGINVPCDYLVFLEVEKFDGKFNRRLRPMEVRQIAGRTGRFGLSGDDCFVSSVTVGKLDVVRKNYDTKENVERAYIGMDFEFFNSCPRTMNVYNRILKFEKTDIVPENLKKFISKEDLKKYYDIYSVVDKAKFDVETKWVLLNAPVKQNNKSYFSNLVYHYQKDNILVPPHIQHNKNGDAKHFEDSISQIELYLNLSRHLHHISDAKENIIRQKEKLIDRLTEILLDKKLSTKKTCKLCPKLLSITHPYPYCEECYEEKVKVNYNDWNDDFY